MLVKSICAGTRYVRLMMVAALVFLLTYTYGVRAQNPYIPFHYITNTSGLSQNHVTSILQDDQGFIWFGTSEGLNRYDGYEFTVYRHQENDSTSIPHDNINALIKDHNGELWIGSVNGLARYNRATNSFSSFVYNPKKKDGISWGRVNDIVEDPQGNFWIAFISGEVDYFDRHTGIFTHYQIASDAVSNSDYGEATTILEDHNGNVWIGSFKGITVLNAARRVVTTFTSDAADQHSLTSDHVHHIFQDKDGIIWVATDNGINKFNVNDHNFTRYTHNNNDDNTIAANVVRRIDEDKEGRLWIGTENGGLDILDKTKNKFYHFKQNKADKTAISDNSIYCLFRDKFDNMWVGTNSQGVVFYDRFTKPFVVYQSSPGVSTNLSHNKVTAIAEEPGKGFWVATDGGGLNFFNPQTNLFTAYRHKPSDATSIASDFVVDVVWDDESKCLWTGSWAGGLSRMDTRTGKFKNYVHDELDSTSLPINDLWRLELHQEKIYIGTIGYGLAIFDKKTERFTNFSTDKGLSEKNVVSFLHDSKGNLWIGGWERGINLMNATTHKFLTAPKNIKLLSVYSIKEDYNGKILFTTSTGITIYNPNDKSVTKYGKKDGLPGSNVNAIADDRKGNYWLSTNNGLVKFNIKTNKINVFNVSDRLPTNQFSGRVLRASNGKMYFGSVNGLIVFHPDSIKTNTNVPPVVITDLKIFNKSVPIGGHDNILTKPISETREISLPYSLNFFSLSFVALNYTSSERNQYAYKLDGFDSDWIKVNGRTATYTNLDAATYTFIVKASNNDGLWNEEGTRLIIHILPPWWQTWYFRIFVILFMIATPILIVLFRTRRIQKANRRLAHTVNEKTKELQETNIELMKREEEIAAKNKTLSLQSEELAAQNEELIQSQEEISAQRDLVSHQNQNLEEEVAKRTRELVEYNHQLEQFAFISAHNLRAPVARILGLGHLLSLPNSPEEKEQIYPKLIHNTQELDSVVRDLNAILELKKNNESFITDVDLDKELNMLHENLESEINNTQAQITADFSQVQVIRTVKPYLDSIVYNLVSNAMKYRHPDRVPHIHLKTERVNGEVCLSVADNGLGIDVALFRNKIFTLYSRFHEHIEGKGMGLYLVKTQLTSLGGRIEVESEVGKGTTFKAFFKNHFQ